MVTELVLETPAPAEPSRRRDFGSSARLWAGFLGRAWLWFLAGCLIVTFLPMLFGWRPYVVESGSMTPRINVGDVILSSPEHDPNKLLGHVAIFKDPDAARAGTIKSHRIVRINPDGTLVSKGDANPTVDPVPVPPQNVKGIGRLLVRWIGLPLIWTQKGEWLKLALLVASLWLAAVFVVRDRDEPRDDEDEDDDGGDDGGDGGEDGDAEDDDAENDDEASDDDDGDEDETSHRPERQKSPSGRLVWKPRAAGLRRLRRARHRRPLSASEFVKALAVRVGIVAVGSTALLVPTARAALSATTTDTGSVWSTAASFGPSYTDDVQALNPYLYWKLDDATSTTALDYSGNNRNGAYSPSGSAALTMRQTGGLVGQSPNYAVNFGGGVSDNTTCVTTNAAAESPAPATYSEIIWFSTTSTQPGKLIGFESSQTGVSDSGNGGQYDRQLYMDANGALWFGVWTGATTTVNSGPGYNDGAWHMAVATMGADGMKLYVDDVLVDSDANAVSQDYANGGWWRVGCGNLSGWGANTTQTNYGFAGSLDEATVYTSELTAANIGKLWTDVNPAPTPPPTVPQLANNGFENGTTSWTGDCDSLGASGDPAAGDGSNSLKVTAWQYGNGNNGTPTANCGQSIALSANTTYTLTVDVYGNDAMIGVSGGAQASKTVSPGNNWRTETLTFTTGANGTVTIYLQTSVSGGHGGLSINTVYADDFSIASA